MKKFEPYSDFIEGKCKNKNEETLIHFEFLRIYYLYFSS